MKKLTIIAAILISALFIFASCSSGGGDGGNNPGFDSETNVQVKGIDEGDIVKTSGNYIFKVQTNGISVTKVSDGHMELLDIVADSNLIPIEAIVYKNLLLTIVGKSNTKIYGSGDYSSYYKSKYDQTLIYVFDFSDVQTTGLKMVYSFKLSGNYFQSRMFKDTGIVYAVFSVFDSGHTIPTNGPYNSSNTAINYAENGAGKKVNEFLDLSNIGKIANNFSGTKGTVFFKLDLNNFKSCVTAHINAKIFDLYISKFAIYPIYNLRETVKNSFSFTCFFTNQINKDSSVIVKLDFNLSYKHKIVNSGFEIYSRYALFDNGENFFYAASDLKNWNNALFAYDNYGNLKSKIEFGKGEKIYSVNYDNNKCFAITFRQTDPLFEFDISNPNGIKLVGELEIPDYSTYLYPYSEELLIGLGVSFNPNGIKLDLYRVGTGGNPIREYSLVIAGAIQNEVPALFDPRAILIGPGYFGFALERYTGGYHYQEFWVFEIFYSAISDEYSFSEPAKLSNFTDGKIDGGWDAAFDKVITRAVVINDYLYTVSNGYITSYSKGIAGFEFIEQLNTKGMI